MRSRFPLYNPSHVREVKDPCLVYDGSVWHIFGSGGDTISETWSIHHATSPSLAGPWTQHPHIDLPVSGSGVAAPGVVFSDGAFHLFIQTEFMREGGRIEYFTSPDGFAWLHVNTPLLSLPGTAEAGIYDPHPAIVAGQKVLVYSAMPPIKVKPAPEIFLAISASGEWAGPWTRAGMILSHADLTGHHNQPGDADYEWGIEGPQLVELPDGRVLLNAVCFLPSGERGTRQRVFFAVAPALGQPFRSLGPYLQPTRKGENGHASAMLVDKELVLCYQARPKAGTWRYGIRRHVKLPPLDRLSRPAA
jgi:hypothetical protein